MLDLQDEIRLAKILVIDDDLRQTKLTEDSLGLVGFQNLVSTTDPRDACSLHEKFEFDLVILDLNMPTMDGFQVMARLHEFMDGDYLPILVISGQADRESMLRALENGAKDFITKPFGQREFHRRVKNLLEVHFLYRRQRDASELLEKAVQERTQELVDTQIEILRRLARAGEYRDNETGMHVIRMSKSCQLLALEHGLNDRQANLILNASPMHDIGKIGIPDRILLKPGKLSVDEIAVIKTHPEIGKDILSGHSSEILLVAETIAFTHHEYWDGSGYPMGSRGEDIPLEGRICAISDVFDALTSKRPYKLPWTTDKAIGLINENAGRQFDPDLVASFNRILPEVLANNKSYPDDDKDIPLLQLA